MEESQVAKAVAALQQYHTVSRRKGKPHLVEDNPFVSLIIALKKVPDRTHRRPYFIPLPHTLYPPEETEVCLFTKTDKKTAKEQLHHRGVEGIAKVIPMDKLKTKFKSFESKRQLSASYDLFLTDKRIYHLLPRLLGKKFFQKKRYPIPIDMTRKELATVVQKARNSTYLHLGLGPCCAIPIGRISYPTTDVVENVTLGMETIATIVSRGWQNIQSVHLKTPDSIALPIFNSAPPDASFLPAVEAGARKRKVAHLEPEDEDDAKEIQHKKVRFHDDNEEETPPLAQKPKQKRGRAAAKGVKRRRTKTLL